MGVVQRGLLKLVLRAVSFPKLTLLVCGIALLGSAVFARMHLTLSTDQDELLTTKLQFFREFKDFTRRFAENDSYQVILEPVSYQNRPSTARWAAFADRLKSELLNLKEYVIRVDTRVPPQDLGAQGLLFADWDEVREQNKQVDQFVQFGRIVGDPDALTSRLASALAGNNMTRRTLTVLAQGPAGESMPLALEMVSTLANAVESRRDPKEWTWGREIASMAAADPRSKTDPRMLGYQMQGDETRRVADPAGYRSEQILVITVYTQRDYSSLSDITEPLQLMRGVVEKVARDFPEFKPPVITGRVALEADEMRTSDHDTRVAEILGLSLVFVVLLMFLRNLWLVIVAEIALGTGIGWTFGWATLAVGRLNLLSLVFVIALIGIGMDYLIQVLTRYRFEKKRYRRPVAVWARVFRYVSPPIFTACCGAAGAFFVSLLTNFRGAGELGLIAGGGLLLCLLTGYTVVPAVLTLFPAGVGKVHESRRYKVQGPHPRAGGLRLIPAALWILVAGAGLFKALPPEFDANLLRLQADNLPSVREVRKINTWSAVVMTPDLEELRAARAALMPGPDDVVILRTESILDAQDKRQWLVAQNAGRIQINWKEPAPPAPADLAGIAEDAQSLVTAWKRDPRAGDLSALEAAAARLSQVLRSGTIPQQEKIDRVAEWQRRFVREVRVNIEQFAPPPVDVEALPVQLREHLMSDKTPSGGTGPRMYALYLYPKADLWESGNLARFVNELEDRFATHKAATHTHAVLTGIAPQLLHSTGEISRAFLLSTCYALGLIVLLVLLDLRKISQTLLAISVLALGLPMLLLLMYLWHNLDLFGATLEQRTGIPGTWNFANFFALPILIGAGHEYGVFLVHRYRETLHDPRRVWRPWDVSDRALLLCAIVTSCSFGFLVRAQHHGLQSLGWVMAVGTACIYLASLLVLRPILTWRLKGKGVYYENGNLKDKP